MRIITYAEMTSSHAATVTELLHEPIFLGDLETFLTEYTNFTGNISNIGLNVGLVDVIDDD